MNFSYRLGWLFFRALYATYGRWRVYNRERVPLTGPVVLACNHASYLDPPLVGAGLHRPLHYMARDTLFKSKVVGGILRSWRAIPVDRDGGGAAGVRQVLQRLQEGGAVLLFPEGTRTRDGRLQRARSGIGLVVLKTTAPVVPVRVFGTYEAYNRWMKIPRPRRVTVKYGEPFYFERERAEAEVCSKARLRELYEEIAVGLMEAIGKLGPWEDKTRFP